MLITKSSSLLFTVKYEVYEHNLFTKQYYYKFVLRLKVISNHIRNIGVYVNFKIYSFTSEIDINLTINSI